MKYAIVSDIHANAQAWEAVFEDILKVGVDEIVCLGDIVGYGPDPEPVLDSIFANVRHTVLGNHDAAVVNKLDLDLFQTEARRIVEWTTSRLDKAARKFLDGLPLVIGNDDFVCAHADVAAPGQYAYIHQPDEARALWDAGSEQVIFIGHTHIPAIHMIGQMGAAHYLPPQDLRCNSEMRYVVNVGSVGQPRDDALDASYCIFDSDAGRIAFRRVSYDVNAHLAALRRHGLEPHPCMLEGTIGSAARRRAGMEFRPPPPPPAGPPPGHATTRPPSSRTPAKPPPAQKAPATKTPSKTSKGGRDASRNRRRQTGTPKKTGIRPPAGRHAPAKAKTDRRGRREPRTRQMVTRQRAQNRRNAVLLMCFVLGAGLLALLILVVQAMN